MKCFRVDEANVLTHQLLHRQDNKVRCITPYFLDHRIPEHTSWNDIGDIVAMDQSNR